MKSTILRISDDMVLLIGSRGSQFEAKERPCFSIGTMITCAYGSLDCAMGQGF